MITIIDYQISNLFSVQHACEYLGLEAEISSDKNKLLTSEAAILPGVGAFGDVMRNLKNTLCAQHISCRLHTAYNEHQDKIIPSMAREPHKQLPLQTDIPI